MVAIAGPGWLLIHAGRGLSDGINGGTRVLGTSSGKSVSLQSVGTREMKTQLVLFVLRQCS